MGGKKLTHDQVRLIRHLYKTGDISMRELARMFKVSATQISRILSRKHRADIKDWLSDEDIRLGRVADTNKPMQVRSNKKLTDSQVDEIRDRYAAGDGSTRSLAGEYGISQMHVSRIISNKSRISV